MKLKNKLMFLLALILSSSIIGVVSAVFLKGLYLAEKLRTANPYLLYFIPVVGVLTAVMYTEYGKNSNKGNNLIIESIDTDVKVPMRMGFLTFIFTLLTHLSGGSAGREGTAVQMGGTITNKIGTIFNFSSEEKRILVMSGISAGFGSVFGTPLTGAIFGMEVCYLGKMSYEGLFPCVIAGYLADFVAQKICGATHTIYQIKEVPELTVRILLIVIFSSVIFALAGKLFSKAVHFFKGIYSKNIKNYILRAFIGALVVTVLLLLFDNIKYSGLSTWLIGKGFVGETTFKDSIMKLLLTTLTLGAGFQGGEVTPLFDIGASLGGAISNLFSLEPSLLAGIGMIIVFGSCTNTPIATLILGIEMFGAQGLFYYAISVVVSYYTMGYSGIYHSQKIFSPKSIWHKDKKNKKLGELQ